LKAVVFGRWPDRRASMEDALKSVDVDSRAGTSLLLMGLWCLKAVDSLVCMALELRLPPECWLKDDG